MAHFPKEDQVVVSAEGVFIPRALFGESPDLCFDIQNGPRGKKVVVFSKPSTPEGNDRSESGPSLKLERRWLAENRAKYMGQWVALSGDRLVASGLNGKEVCDTARALGVAIPFMSHIHPDDDRPFAGW